MDKYVAVIGGKDALMKITDLTTNMSADMNGNAIIITCKQKLPISSRWPSTPTAPVNT